MKRVVFIILACIAALILFGKVIPRNAVTPQKVSQVASPKALPQTTGTLVLNDGQTIATYSGIAAKNAFELLTIVGEKNNIPVVTKQYDFGVFVEEVRGKKSGADMSWIYFVNGKSGTVAADKYELKNGDVVEWKYTKPIY